jgi:anti-sigma B factor antagonist
MMATLELTTGAGEDPRVVALRGELDYLGSAEVEAAMTALMVTARGQSLIIDMSALDFIDCASLGALCRVQRLARQTGGDVMLAAPRGLPLRVLTLIGANGSLCAHPSVQFAVISIGLASKVPGKCAAV